MKDESRRANYYDVKHTAEFLGILAQSVRDGRHSGPKLKPYKVEGCGTRNFYLKKHVKALKLTREELHQEKQARANAKYREKVKTHKIEARTRERAQGQYRYGYTVTPVADHWMVTVRGWPVAKCGSAEGAEDYIRLQRNKLQPVHTIFY